MRKIALAAAAAALLVSAAPVTAEEPVIVPTTACETSSEYTTLSLAGAKETVTPSAIPAVGHDFDDLVRDEAGQPAPDVPYHPQSTVSYKFRLDVSGSPTVPDAKVGTVNLNLSWDNQGDYDMYVYDAAGNPIGDQTNSFNPQSGAGETDSLPKLAHCTDFRIDIVNYLGASPATAMELTAKVASLKP